MLLQGLKVVELATFIAGPAAAGMMADWGAEVVKIEALTGDAIRWVRPELRPEIPPNFEIDNHGKRSIALDYSNVEGRKIIHALLEDADVFITSMRQSSLARAGFDFASLHRRYPKLVYASVSGYGLAGPGADQLAFDLTAFWSRSSIARQSFHPDAMPAGVPTGVGDHITAISVALGVMTALVERSRTGAGRLVDASLLRTGVYVGSYAMVEWTRRGVTLEANDRTTAETTLFHRSGDGRWFSFYPNHPAKDWPAIFAAANRPDLAGDPRFASKEARGLNGRALIDALDAGFDERTFAEIAVDLERSGMAWSLVQDVAEAVVDPLVEAAECFLEVDDGEGGSFPVAGPPVRFPGAERKRAGIVPRIGEHTDEVLRELGYDDDAIATLKRDRIVRAVEPAPGA